MNLRIQHQPSLLGLDIKSPRLEMSRKDSTVRHSGGESKIKIDIKNGQFRIDNTAARQALDIYDYKPFMSNMANDGLSTSMQGIARIVQDGFQMLDVHKNGDVIPKLAEQNAWAPTREVEVKYKPGTQVDYTPNSLHIDFDLVPFKVIVSPNDFQANLDRGTVEAYLRQKEFFDIEWVGSNVDFVR